jgi:hypothetical protein
MEVAVSPEELAAEYQTERRYSPKYLTLILFTV